MLLNHPLPLTVIWSVVFPLYVYGLGEIWNKLLKSERGLVWNLSTGLALSVFLQTLCLFWAIPLKMAYPILLIFGCVFGLLGIWQKEWGSFCKIGKNNIWLLCCVFAILFSHYLRMLTPNGGAESFQYHYFLPKLFVEQGQLDLTGFELYDALLNVWGLEVLLSMPEYFGGLHFMMIQFWWLLVICCLQLYSATKMLFPEINGLHSCLWMLFCSFYSYLLWWSKPELLATGYSAYLISYLLSSKNKGDLSIAVGIALMFSSLLSFKITCLVLCFPILVATVYIRKEKTVWLLTCILACIFFLSPWIIFILEHKGGLGTFPTDNYSNFSAPLVDSYQKNSSMIPKFFKDTYHYFLLFKPGIFLFILGFPLFIWKFYKYWLLPIGLLFNWGLAFLLINDLTPFCDEFRYTSFTLFVIPMGAAIVSESIFKNNVLKILLITFFIAMTYQRLYTINHETFKYHRSYLFGNQTFVEATTKEGSLAYQVYLNNRSSDTEKLLHIGNGNYFVHGPSVIHVGSWSKNYPVWKYSTSEDLKAWLHGMGVKWILLERWRYESFARGFGGVEYLNSPLTAYYAQSLLTLNSCEKFLVTGSDARYSLYYFP